MFTMRVDLNPKLEEGLESAFQQTNHMFDADADLEEIRRGVSKSRREVVMDRMVLPSTSSN
jgi:hypothetical protein